MTKIEQAILLLVENGYAVYRSARSQEPDGARPIKRNEAKPARPATPAVVVQTHTQSRGAYTIPQFCDSHCISRTHFYQLLKEGHGPRLMKVGRRTLISQEAATEWIAMMTVDALPEQTRQPPAPKVPKGATTSERDACIVGAFRQGHTRRQIGDALGITEQRVGQILRANGIRAK